MRPFATLAAVVTVVCLARVPVAQALAKPELSLQAGGTFAVNGEPGDGGLSISGAALWPVEDRFRFGVTLFADDQGAKVGRLIDPNDGTDLGAAEELHRDVWGGGWRLDALLPAVGGWTPYASGAWNAYRVVDDQRGVVRDALCSTGFMLGGGISRALMRSGSLGATVRYHRLFNDVAGRYMSAGIEWRWTWSTANP